MAIIKNTYGWAHVTGRVKGQVFKINQSRSIVQSHVVRATRKGTSLFRRWRDLSESESRWDGLPSSSQNSWNSFASSTQHFDVEGFNGVVTGSRYYATFNTNRRTFNGATDWVDEAPDQPAWGDRPKFYQFAGKADDLTLWFTTATEFPAGTRIVAMAQPPVQSGKSLIRAGLKYLGTVTFDTSLQVGSQTSAFTELYREEFGDFATGRKWGNWFLLWQIEEGYMRVLKDPCVTPYVTIPRRLVLDVRNDNMMFPAHGPGGRIIATNGAWFDVGHPVSVNNGTFNDVWSWEQWTAPGPSPRWQTTVTFDDGHQVFIDQPITYPFTNAIIS